MVAMNARKPSSRPGSPRPGRGRRTPAGGRAEPREQTEAGGHATLFRGALRAGETVFTLPQENVLRIQRRLKKLFDPHNILNRGRMPGLS